MPKNWGQALSKQIFDVGRLKVFGQVPSEVLGEHGHPDVKLCAMNIFHGLHGIFSISEQLKPMVLHHLRYHLQRANIVGK